MATPLPEVNSSPLFTKPIDPSPTDMRKLWEAVQRLQADVNQLIQHVAEQETPTP